MRINVKVVANAKRNDVKQENNTYKVYLTAPPVEGKANELLIEVLSVYFHVRKNKVFIVEGEKRKVKVIEVIS